MAAAHDPRPVLFVTTEIPPDRVGAFRALAELVPIEFALFGGGLHATAGVTNHGLPAREVSQKEIFGLAASGRYRAVVAGTAGRIALPAAWAGAERARVPFILWTALWAHPRSAAHLPGAFLLRLLYRRAAVVVTYGPHVSRFAERLGAKRTIVAPQAVDRDFWAAPAEDAARALDAETSNGSASAETSAAVPRLLYVGRDDPGKGVDWLLAAWDASGLGRPAAPAGPSTKGSSAASEALAAELRLIGPAPSRATGHAGVTALGPLAPARVREEMRGAAAVVVPSERTATFREPWGLVVNEAMHTGALVIASTEVGAAAGGLVAAQTGVTVPAGNVNGLATALRFAAAPEAPQHRAIREAARSAVIPYTQNAWAAAFAAALNGSVACRS